MEEDVKKILYQQLQLLAEESKNAKPNEKGYKPGLKEYSEAICQISDSYSRILNAQKGEKEN